MIIDDATENEAAENASQELTEEVTELDADQGGEDLQADDEGNSEDTAAENAGEEGEGSQFEEEDNQPRKKNGFEKRIDKLRQQREQARQEAEQYRQRAEELEKQQAEIIEDEDGEYETALVKNASIETAKLMAQEHEKTARQNAQQAMQAEWTEKLQAAADKIPDMVETIEDPNFKVSEAMLGVILTSDQGPQLAYHLAKNPALTQKVAQMPPLEAAKELGRLEAKLTPPKPKIATNAPKPVHTVSSQSAPATKEVEDMTYDEYRAYREAQGVNRIG